MTVEDEKDHKAKMELAIKEFGAEATEIIKQLEVMKNRLRNPKMRELTESKFEVRAISRRQAKLEGKIDTILESYAIVLEHQIHGDVTKYQVSRYALMTHGNSGANPEYKYWTRRLDGPRLSNGGCYENFKLAIDSLKVTAIKDNKVVHFVGIFDGMTERGTHEDKFAGVAGLPIKDIGPEHEIEIVR